MRPSLLLLPGMMLDQRAFTAQMAFLSPTVDVAVGDLSKGDCVEEIARHVLDEAPARFALAGLSMGGIIGFEIWRQAPDRITHLALLDTTPHADRPDRSQQRLDQMAAVDQGQLRDVITTALTPQYLAVKNRVDTVLLQEILEMGLSLGPQVFRSQSMALMSRPDSLPILSAIDCPVLVLCGRDDTLCTVAIHQLMAESIPYADLVVLAECGHLSTLEEPLAVGRALERLLGRNGARP